MTSWAYHPQIADLGLSPVIVVRKRNVMMRLNNSVAHIGRAVVHFWIKSADLAVKPTILFDKILLCQLHDTSIPLT